MQTTPNFVEGDVVRIMQTDTMVEFGHANKLVKVTMVTKTAADSYRFITREIVTNQLIILSAHSMVRMTRTDADAYRQRALAQPKENQ